MRLIGLHLRLEDKLSSLFERALELKIPVFQCFLLQQSNNQYATFSNQEIKKCQHLAEKFDQIYLHASYWVNLSGRRNNGWRAFQRELSMAKLLGFTHIVIHPGSSTGCQTKTEGIEYLAKALNKALSLEKEIKIVVENIAHGNKNVGGDLEDFKLLLSLINEPERLFFCIDTAHAHAFGYDIINNDEQNAFLNQVETILQDKLVLLHLNETQKEKGSQIDKHDALGQGAIGNQALKRFINHPVCKHVPIILELPLFKTKEKKEQEKMLAIVRNWSEN